MLVFDELPKRFARFDITDDSFETTPTLQNSRAIEWLTQLGPSSSATQERPRVHFRVHAIERFKCQQALSVYEAGFQATHTKTAFEITSVAIQLHRVGTSCNKAKRDAMQWSAFCAAERCLLVLEHFMEQDRRHISVVKRQFEAHHRHGTRVREKERGGVQ